MATYVMLMKMGSGGAGVDDEPIADAIADGAPESNKLVESYGGKVIGNYMTMGQYDFVSMVEFPDDESCARVALQFKDFGVVTETMRAFPEDEWPAISKGM